MNILFVSSRIIWPCYGGREVSLNSRINTLIKQGHNVDIFICGKSQQSILNPLNLNIMFGNKIPVWKKMFNTFLSLFSSKKPMQSSLFIDGVNKKKLSKIVMNYDCIFIDMIRLAPLYKTIRKKYDKKLILDLDDLISKRYDKDSKEILGQSEEDNTFFSKVLRFNFIRKTVLKLEKNKIKKAELFYSTKYDSVCLINENEMKELSQMVNCNAIYFPMVIPKKSFCAESKKYNLLLNETMVVGFAGLLKTPANLDSLKYIIENILPKLNFDYKFLVVGKADEEVVKRYTSSKINFLGFVENFQQTIQQFDVMLCPMTYGTGIKTKILEAMAAGVPVITNSVGAYGICAKNEEDYFVYDDVNEIINTLNLIKNDNFNLKTIAMSGYTKIKSNYSEDNFIDVFNKLVH